MSLDNVSDSIQLRKPSSKQFIDMTGRKFGLLTVKSVVELKGRLRLWRCECECGGEVKCWGNTLRQGRHSHCGCLAQRDGHSRHPLFKIWLGMIQRCENQNAPGFKNYGGRGIAVCDGWRKSFRDFAEDVGERPSASHSLDRINNAGNYEPGNCRWATQREQQSNTRRTRHVTINGETKTMAEWARVFGISRQAMFLRLKKENGACS
jgi:hypothetical protein